MKRLAAVLLVACVLVGTAAAATIRGSARADRIDAGNGRRDAVACGRGADYVVADIVDRVARDCERVARRISTDPYTSDGAQHRTAAEPAVASSRSTVVAAFQVGRYNNGGATNIGFAVSRDAGRTWRSGLLPSLTVASKPAGTWTRASDPSVAYDAAHRTWLVTSLALGAGSSAVVVNRSADGLHWGAPVAVTEIGNDRVGDILLDKEWIACDDWTTSPHRGRCHVTYTDISNVRIAEQFSDDGGLTWSAKVGVVTGSDVVGAIPAVQRDGSVVVVLANLPRRGGEIDTVRSADGGATYGNVTVISDALDHGVFGMRAEPLPSIAVDAGGTVYVAWNDCRFRAGCNANDIVLASSADGTTWTQPRRIPLEPSTSHVDDFDPGLGADPARPGRIALVYTRNICTVDCRLSVGFVASSNGGTSWTPPVRLDARPVANAWLARSGSVGMIGDYQQTAFAGGRAVPVFVLAGPPRAGRLDQAVVSTSLAVR